MEIQKIFTNIRNSLNNREDELLIEVDKEFYKLFGDENIIKEGEKLPEKIKKSLEKQKILGNEWNDNKLISIINDCINIENDISQINGINENINKCKKNNKIKISLYLNNDEINKLTENIKNLGRISLIFFSKINFNESIEKDWIGKNFTTELLFSTSKNGFEPKKVIKYHFIILFFC